MAKWADKIEDIRAAILRGVTLETIGETYGVSRQRMYQICTQYGIRTACGVRSNYLRDMPPERYWLNRLLCTKQISVEDRLALLTTLELPKTCPVLGLPLDYDTARGKRIRDDNSPSLDQIVPRGGYKPGNVQVISFRANRIKSDATPEDLRKIADYMAAIDKR